MPSVISGDANVSATEFGFLDGVTSGLQSQIDSKLNLAGGKILQIVRATDSTQRSTTSTTYVDVTGMSVTITPQKSDSAVLVIATYFLDISGGSPNDAALAITDNSNNTLSGAQRAQHAINAASGVSHSSVIIGYSTPATTSATTYKVQLRSNSGTVHINRTTADTDTSTFYRSISTI